MAAGKANFEGQLTAKIIRAKHASLWQRITDFFRSIKL